jgi:50S ribosomal protein L16 3-hydroxylase
MKPIKPAKPAAKPSNRPLPFEIDAHALPPLGMPAAVFLRDYWQKRPLLIRNAFARFAAPDGGSPIEPEDLAGLACEETALSRIVVHDRASDVSPAVRDRLAETLAGLADGSIVPDVTIDGQ